MSMRKHKRLVLVKSRHWYRITVSLTPLGMSLMENYLHFAELVHGRHRRSPAKQLILHRA